ncbi:hypothetical protein [Corynebacterium macginleyi]|uniref:hypothetical protein n=1 Tax=Corynebacterium macginleyi TaxID=38290 RepID=UPI003080D760
MDQLNPTRQEIIDAHQVVKNYIEHELDVAYTEMDTEEALRRERLLLKFLPPIPRVTLNDIFWVVSELLFAEVENIESGELGILLAYDVMPDGEKFMYVNHFDGDIHRYSPGMLTLTGEKYTLEKETPND